MNVSVSSSRHWQRFDRGSWFEFGGCRHNLLNSGELAPGGSALRLQISPSASRIDSQDDHRHGPRLSIFISPFPFSKSPFLLLIDHLSPFLYCNRQYVQHIIPSQGARRARQRQPRRTRGEEAQVAQTSQHCIPPTATPRILTNLHPQSSSPHLLCRRTHLWAHRRPPPLLLLKGIQPGTQADRHEINFGRSKNSQ
jgi:hypothetical protein